MKHKKLRIVPQGMGPLYNAEAAKRGEAQTLVNLREREDCLVAVGSPAPAGNIPYGHRLLAINGDHLITARDSDVAIDGTVVATVRGNVLHARVLGRFIIVATTCQCVVLHQRDNGYVTLTPEEAVPRVTLAATATSRFTATVPAVTFENPYRTWQAPLTAQDQRMVLAAVGTAWRDARAAATAAGRHCGPLLARYGVRLWDDSYLWMSQPVVVGGATIHSHYRTSMALTTGNSQFTGTQQGTLGLDAYALDIVALDAIPSAWRPLVKAIDVLTTPATSAVSTTLDYRCAFDTSRVPVLEAGLKPRPDNQLWNDLFGAQWTVVATATPAPDGTLTFSTVATPSMRFSNAQLAPLMSHLAWEQLECATLVHDGRLHLAPLWCRPVNPWHAAMWCEAVTGDPCEATVTVTLIDEQGMRHVTTREQLAGTPTVLNALITYPDVRATHIAISAGGRCWQADLVPWQEAGLAMAVASTWEGHATSTGTIAASNEIEGGLVVRAVLEVSEVQNPFVFTTVNVGLHYDIVAMAAAVTPIYNGGFGRYPLYLFTTGGIYALAQGAAAYGGTRYVSELLIDGQVAPVTGGGRVWFFDKEGRVCALHGAKAEVMSGLLGANSLAWNSVERELAVCGLYDTVPTLMPSGHFYYRHANWQQVFSDEAHALAVDFNGNLFNMLHEDTTGDVEVEYRSRPMRADEFMRCAPHRLVWSGHAHDAQLSFKLLGSRMPAPVAPHAGFDVTECPHDSSFLITAMDIEGHLLRPLVMRVAPLPQRAFILEVTGHGTDISLHPTLVEKR